MRPFGVYSFLYFITQPLQSARPVGVDPLRDSVLLVSPLDNAGIPSVHLADSSCGAYDVGIYATTVLVSDSGVGLRFRLRWNLFWLLVSFVLFLALTLLPAASSFRDSSTRFAPPPMNSFVLATTLFAVSWPYVGTRSRCGRRSFRVVSCLAVTCYPFAFFALHLWSRVHFYAPLPVPYS